MEDETKELKKIRKRQNAAIVLHVVLVMLYIITGIVLVVVQGHCRMDIPVYVIYTIEIVVCCVLLFRAERALRRKLNDSGEIKDRTEINNNEEKQEG